jgi:hypothetical protein
MAGKQTYPTTKLSYHNPPQATNDAQIRWVLTGKAHAVGDGMNCNAFCPGIVASNSTAAPLKLLVAVSIR